jgi:hypothetical protein
VPTPALVDAVAPVVGVLVVPLLVAMAVVAEVPVAVLVPPLVGVPDASDVEASPPPDPLQPTNVPSPQSASNPSMPLCRSVSMRVLYTRRAWGRRLSFSFGVSECNVACMSVR